MIKKSLEVGGGEGRRFYSCHSRLANLLMKEAPISIVLALQVEQLKVMPFEASNFKRSLPLAGMSPVAILYSILDWVWGFSAFSFGEIP